MSFGRCKTMRSPPTQNSASIISKTSRHLRSVTLASPMRCNNLLNLQRSRMSADFRRGETMLSPPTTNSDPIISKTSLNISSIPSASLMRCNNLLNLQRGEMSARGRKTMLNPPARNYLLITSKMSRSLSSLPPICLMRCNNRSINL